jgi:hypothetical protein
MVDELSERYRNLLTGVYDCVDRIVLNAYFPLGHSPGGFRVWWRRWHDDSDEQPRWTSAFRTPSRVASRSIAALAACRRHRHPVERDAQALSFDCSTELIGDRRSTPRARSCTL